MGQSNTVQPNISTSAAHTVMPCTARELPTMPESVSMPSQKQYGSKRVMPLLLA
jgi:hypothetical protein